MKKIEFEKGLEFEIDEEVLDARNLVFGVIESLFDILFIAHGKSGCGIGYAQCVLVPLGIQSFFDFLLQADRLFFHVLCSVDLRIHA